LCAAIIPPLQLRSFRLPIARERYARAKELTPRWFATIQNMPSDAKQISSYLLSNREDAPRAR
jgi:hypothetical protein